MNDDLPSPPVALLIAHPPLISLLHSALQVLPAQLPAVTVRCCCFLMLDAVQVGCGSGFAFAMVVQWEAPTSCRYEYCGERRRTWSVSRVPQTAVALHALQTDDDEEAVKTKTCTTHQEAQVARSEASSFEM